MADNNAQANKGGIPTIQKFIAILWPSFLGAGIQTIIFFTLFDPLNVFTEYEVSRLGAYSIGFFLFWGFAIIPCILTMYFAKPCAVYREELGQDKN